MKSTTRFADAIRRSLASPGWLLGAGLVLNLFSQMRWNVAILAWFSFVPFLRYLRLGYNRWALWIVLTLTLALSTARIASEPFYLMIALVEGLQGGIIYMLILLIWNFIRVRGGEIAALFAFPALIACFEWLGGHLSVLGAWGMLVNSQIDNLPLLQFASVTGAVGISFLIAWSNALAENLVRLTVADLPLQRWSRQISLFAAVLVCVYAFGAYRLFSTFDGKTMRVATVTTKFELQDVLHNREGEAANEKALFEKSGRAADLGAKIVVWNEGAAVVNRSDEPQFVERTKSLAKNRGIDIVAAYVVSLSDETVKFENKLHWITPAGEIAWTYYKQFIPPGEPSVHVESELKAADVDGARVSAAICYDFDSLALTRSIGALDAGIVLLPSSDWKGIDPFHTQMASLRGIENGYSVVRSVRASASAAFDPNGRVRGWLDYFEKNDGIMTAVVPVARQNTVHRVIGDLPVAVCAMFLFVALAGAFRNRSES